MNFFGKGGSDQTAPLLGIGILLAGAAGVYFWVEPLRTFRPAGQEERRPPLEPRLPARLWQDPLELARQQVARVEPEKKEMAQGQVARVPAPAEDALALAVTVYGGYGQLEHETRLRSRYAVEQALNDVGYVPFGLDTVFLRYVVVEWEEDGLRALKVLPFELWRRERPGAGPPEALVLWIDDSILGATPWGNLLKFVEKAGLTGPWLKNLRMIGPPSSTDLQNLMEEDGDWPLRVHSPWATADEAFLPRPDALGPAPKVDRTIANDRQACGLLLKELRQRNVRMRKKMPDPRNPAADGADTIAVLSEWDTVYGRAFPFTFAACVLTSAERQDCDEAPELFRRRVRELKLELTAWPPEILRVVYLRGLDGSGPQSPDQAQEEKGQEKESKPGLDEMERPDGPSQLDYARRLADLLVRTHPTLRAVGVLGADIYDKLLLLQALRERLPGVLFFTTDLDAGYLHPSQNEWSRNLLVASGYGLSEPPAAAPRTHLSPPFRDTYGVAIQRAVRHALTGRVEEVPPPAVYEIGRTAAHVVKQGPSGAASAGGAAAWRVILWLLLLALLAGTMLMMHVGKGFLWPWLGALAFLCALQAMLVAGVRQEPLFWMEGISIWPTELLRLAAVAGACLWLRKAEGDLTENAAGVRETAHFAPLSAAAGPRPAWYKFPAWRSLLEEAAAPHLGCIAAQGLWHLYERADESRLRWIRAGSLAVASTSLIGLALLLERPSRPCRGEFSCGADLVVAGLSIFALLLTTFYVTDVTATCTRWIRGMTAARTSWPQAIHKPGADLPDAWREVETAALRTQVVGRLILGPFAFLLVLILSRSEVFDRWSWPPSLVALFLIPLGLALVSALALRHSAERLRSQALGEVRRIWADALGAGLTAEAEHADCAIKSIEYESRGSFSPFAQNPVLGAFLLPLTGAGTGLVFERLLQSL